MFCLIWLTMLGHSGWLSPSIAIICSMLRAVWSSVSASNLLTGVIATASFWCRAPYDGTMPAASSCMAWAAPPRKPWNIHGCEGFRLRRRPRSSPAERTQCTTSGLPSVSLNVMCRCIISIWMASGAPRSLSRPVSPIITTCG